MTTLSPLPFNSKPIAPATKTIPFSSAPIAPVSIPDIISQHNVENSTPSKNLGDFSADAITEGVNKIKSSITSGGDKMSAGVKEGGFGGLGKILTGIGESGLGTASGFLQTIFSPLTAVINDSASHISDNPIVQKIATSGFGNAIAKGEQGLTDWAQKHPELATNLSDALNVGFATIGDKLAGSPDLKLPDASTLKSDIGNAKDIITSGSKKAIDTLGNAKDTITENIPGNDIPGKMVRRVQDTLDTRAELKSAPKEVQTAVKADIPKAQADFVNNMTDAEKAKAFDMLQKQKVGTKEMVMKPSERPDAVIGERALEPVKFLEQQKNAAIQAEGEHVKNLGGQSVDINDVKSKFLDKLKTLGISERPPEELLNKKGQIDPKISPLDFSKSELSTPASAKDRQLLETAYKELQGPEIKSASDLHTTRQRLFNETQNKNFTEPFSDRIVDLIHNNKGTSLRSDILHAIKDQAGGTGEGYAAEATRNAKIQDALQTFYKAFGKDLNGKDINIQNLKAGEVANRLSGNASSVVENALQKVEGLAREYGYKSDVSTRVLVAFKTMLKNIVGETQHNSLAGAVEQGTKAALPDAAEIVGNVASGSKTGTLKAAVNFAKGNTRAEQIRALEGLLKPKSTIVVPKSKNVDPILGF